jgi:hypothetical protein
MRTNLFAYLPPATAATRAAPQNTTKLRFGETLEQDPRLANIVGRESFLLSVIIPRFRTLRDMRREWWQRTAKSTVWLPCVLCLVLHVGGVTLCASESHSGVCAGGPEADAPASSRSDDDADGSTSSRSYTSWAFTEYGPPVINALATLMMSFYANVCMTLYKECYFAARQLSESVIDRTALTQRPQPLSRVHYNCRTHCAAALTALYCVRVLRCVCVPYTACACCTACVCAAPCVRAPCVRVCGRCSM